LIKGVPVKTKEIKDGKTIEKDTLKTVMINYEYA
jgi:hypothetical protein